MLDDTNTATRILVCGLLAADVVFNVDAVPADAIKYRANQVSLKCGGGGCYAAIAINRLGGNACLLAQLGDEEFGQFMLAALAANNIDCSHVRVEKNTQSPVSSIAIDKTVIGKYLTTAIPQLRLLHEICLSSKRHRRCWLTLDGWRDQLPRWSMQTRRMYRA